VCEAGGGLSLSEKPQRCRHYIICYIEMKTELYIKLTIVLETSFIILPETIGFW